MLAEVEAVVRPDCVLATNTSSLSVTEMASGLAHPERVAGFHLFNPVAMMPLVEVVRGAQTDDATAATALAVGSRAKKNCVLVGRAGPWCRLLPRVLGEGSAPSTSRRGAAPRGGAGLPMTPFWLHGRVTAGTRPG